MRPSHKTIEDVLVRLNPRKTNTPHYERTGKCVRCGVCCSFEDPPCEHFTPATETEPALCAVFGQEERPDFCGEWPPNPPIKIKSCGFRFKNLIEDQDLDIGEV